MLQETSDQLMKLHKRRPGYTSITQAITGCSSEIDRYLLEYSVAFYSLRIVPTHSLLLLSVFGPTANAKRFIRSAGTAEGYTRGNSEPSVLCGTNRNAITWTYYVWLCDTGRRNRTRTSNTGALLHLISGPPRQCNFTP